MSSKEKIEYICGICATGFDGVPKKDIYDTKCSCTDSKFHPGCINMLYEGMTKNSLSKDKCPTCRKDNILNRDDIHKFLLECANREINYNNKGNSKVKKRGIGAKLLKNIKLFFRKLYVGLLKGKTNGHGDVKKIQMVYFVTFMIWLVSSHLFASYLFKDNYNEMRKCQIKVNSSDLESEYLYNCSDFYRNSDPDSYQTIYYLILPWCVILYLIVFINVLRTFSGNVLEFSVFTLMMIIHLCVWTPLIDVNFPEATTRIPSLYLLITYIIKIAISLLLITILRELNTLNDKHKIIKLDGILGYKFKDGYDYEEALEKGEIEHTNVDETEKITTDETKNISTLKVLDDDGYEYTVSEI